MSETRVTQTEFVPGDRVLVTAEFTYAIGDSGDCRVEVPSATGPGAAVVRIADVQLAPIRDEDGEAGATRDVMAVLIAQHRPHFGYHCTCGWVYRGPVDPRGSMDAAWADRAVHLAEVLADAGVAS